MSPWIAVAQESDVPERKGMELLAGDKLIALFKIDGQYFALDAVCPHQGGPLAKGTISGCVLTCPWHGWQFDLRTGQQQIIPTIRQPTYPVKIENGQVFIAIGEET